MWRTRSTFCIFYLICVSKKRRHKGRRIDIFTIQMMLRHASTTYEGKMVDMRNKIRQSLIIKGNHKIHI